MIVEVTPRPPFVGEAHDPVLLIVHELGPLIMVAWLFLVTVASTLYLIEWTTGGIADRLVR